MPGEGRRGGRYAAAIGPGPCCVVGTHSPGLGGLSCQQGARHAGRSGLPCPRGAAATANPRSL